MVFVNGMPLAVIELTNPADGNPTVWSAFHQLQTYQAEVPALFVYNAVLAVSDGRNARLGTLSAGCEWFRPWRTIDGQELAPVFYTELQVAIEGVFERRRFLALLRDFIVFEDDGGALVKKMAGYHQFPRGRGGGQGDAAGGGAARASRPGSRAAWPLRDRGARPVVNRATAGSEWCGTPRAPARA